MINWVEVYEKLQGPFGGNLKYVLPLEAAYDKPELDFVKPKSNHRKLPFRGMNLNVVIFVYSIVFKMIFV